jgi:methyl-accepting chemotaxis protein
VIIEPALRPRLRRVANALVAYGVVGALVAVLGLLALVAGLSRINGLADRLRDDVGGVSVALERTADVLDDAAASARSFGTTVERSTSALTTAATDLRDVVPTLRDLETRANAVSVLGSQPLGPIASLFGQIAGQLSGLDTQLDEIATNLGANRAALDTNASSLATLATQTRAIADRLGGNALPGALDDVRWLPVAVLGIGTIGAAIPAGWWLRRSLEPLAPSRH